MKIHQSISLVLLTFSSYANEKLITTKPKRVTVYLQGAQLYYSEDVNIPTGTTFFSFQGVSPNIDPSTIMASGKGDFMIMETRFNARYPETLPENKSNPTLVKYQRILESKMDSLQDMDYTLKLLEARKRNLVTEKNFLEGNRLLKGETKRDTLALVVEAMEYYRNRMGNIDSEWIKATREEDKLRKLSAGIQERINDINELIAQIQNNNPSESQAPIHEIIVQVNSESAQTGTIQFNYFTTQARWAPSFDLKATASSTAIQLVQKASIFQNSQVDWKQVPLTLSTGNPNLSGTRPYLQPQYVGLYQPIYRTETAVARVSSTLSTVDNETFAMEEKADNSFREAKTTANITSIMQTPINVEYRIEANYTIPSDNKPHEVVIQKKDIDTQFEYFTVPKLDKSAFLQARLINWEELNLLQAEAKIYFDGTFVGKTLIDPSITSDTLTVDLGRDKSLSIERIKQKDKTKEQLIGDQKVITRSFNITVRNTKNNPIKINVQDQLPISNHKDVVIENEIIDGAQKDPTTGLLTWTLNLKPKESKTIKFSYTVKHPKGMVISGF